MNFRATAPLCPACGALFEAKTLFESHVERCTGCGGAWFEDLDSEDARAAPAPIGGAERACPRCNRSLAPTRIGAADALACASCSGLFVPRSSFADLLGAAERDGTVPPPRKHYVRMLAVLRALARQA